MTKGRPCKLYKTLVPTAQVQKTNYRLHYKCLHNFLSVLAVAVSSKYAGAAATMLERPPVEQAAVIQASLVAEPMAELQPRAVAEAELRAAAGEKRAAAAEARAAVLQAKLQRVLCTTRDRLLATAHEEDSIPVERLGRYTGLSVDELMPHRRAMQLLFMAFPEEQKAREFWMYSPED